jgi:signal transduction histidine kinase/FixJ family two-component response regulator
MNMKLPKRKYNRSIAGKIIITSLLACAAVALSLYISRFTFSSILSTVDQLSKPNAKIQLVNEIFRKVVTLDQLQRDRLQRSRETPYVPFTREPQQLHEMLDSLRTMSRESPVQVARIDSMKRILDMRERLFMHYAKLRTDLEKNDTLAGQVKNLSTLIAKVRVGMDSNRVKTSRDMKIVVDTIKEEGKRRSLWDRIFVKKKPQTKQVQRQILEELKVRLDTIGIGSNSDSLAKIGNEISAVEKNRIVRRTILSQRQAEINRTGDILIAQLISILNEIEHDELLRAAEKNKRANETVSDALSNIVAVLIIFVVGTGVLVLLIFADIAQSNRYRRQLIAAKEEAEEAGRVKQRFLANMSHELRTPLQTIIGVSEQIRTMPQPPARDVENIYQSSLHLLQTVNEVLDYSRIVSGKYLLEYKPFNMYSLLSEVQEMIKVQAALKHLSLIFEVNAGKDNYYSGDPFRLKQVMLNMLGNAVKFTTEGSVSLTVNEQVGADDRSLFTFVVRDTGIGISAKDLAIVFNEFEQGYEARTNQGTGLGLSIVKAIVEIHGGHINAESETGKGTKFTITIPYERAEAAPETAPDHATVNYEQHVWVVDDDPFILQLCDGILTKHGINHTCFTNAADVLVLPFPDDLGIVFLDIRMGVMDGISLCKKLKERKAPQPMYIALTAQALPDEREALLNQGFDKLVMKPFREHDLMSAVYGSAYEERTGVSLDLSAINTMTGNNAKMTAMVLNGFMKETETDLEGVRACLAANDGHGLAEVLHRLASRCGQVGAMVLADNMRRAEIALRSGESITAQGIEPNVLERDVRALMDALKVSYSAISFPA